MSESVETPHWIALDELLDTFPSLRAQRHGSTMSSCTCGGVRTIHFPPTRKETYDQQASQTEGQDPQARRT